MDLGDRGEQFRFGRRTRCAPPTSSAGRTANGGSSTATATAPRSAMTSRSRRLPPNSPPPADSTVSNAPHCSAPQRTTRSRAPQPPSTTDWTTSKTAPTLHQNRRRKRPLRNAQPRPVQPAIVQLARRKPSTSSEADARRSSFDVIVRQATFTVTPLSNPGHRCTPRNNMSDANSATSAQASFANGDRYLHTQDAHHGTTETDLRWHSK